MATELVATELVVTELVATELVATELVATELMAKELVAKELSELSAGAMVRAAAMELTAAMAAPAGGMVSLLRPLLMMRNDETLFFALAPWK